METHKYLSEHWPHIRGKLKSRYPELNATDLTLEEGKEEELLHSLELKTGKTKKQLLHEINSFIMVT
jgi:hypothetical protein